MRSSARNSVRAREIDLPALLGALALTLPFHGLWVDHELARRGFGALVAAIALASLAIRGRAAPLGPLRWLLGLIAWFGLGAVIEAGNPLEAWLRIAHWAGLVGLALWARSRAFVPFARAILAASVPTALLVIAQRAGLAWPLGAGPEDPVGTLGNTGVASEWLAVALGCGLASERSERRGIPVLATLSCVALAVGLTGSRGGALAAALALIVSFSFRAGPKALLGAALPASLLVIGVLLAPDRGAGAPGTTSAPDRVETSTDTQTLRVRREIWSSSTELIAERPLFGQGPGQFRREYPRVRSREEIEATTFGRRMPVAAGTAHSDAVETAVEGGLPALLLWGLGVVAVALTGLRSGGRERLAGLAALLGSGLARSAFLNAPAAAAGLGIPLAGSAEARPIGAPTRGGLGAVSIGLAAAGVAITIASWSAADYREHGTTESLDTAVAWHPSEPVYRTMRLASTHGVLDDGTLERREPQLTGTTLEDVEALNSLAPYDALGSRFSAELLSAAGRRSEALDRLQDVLEFDPAAPRAAQLRAVLLCLDGRTDVALDELLAISDPSFDRVALLDQLAAIQGLEPPQRSALRTRARQIEAAEAFAQSATSPGTDTSILRLEREAGRADPVANVLRAAFTRSRPDGNPRVASLMAPSRPLDLSVFERELLDPALTVLGEDPAWAKILR